MDTMTLLKVIQSSLNGLGMIGILWTSLQKNRKEYAITHVWNWVRGIIIIVLSLDIARQIMGTTSRFIFIPEFIYGAELPNSISISQYFLYGILIGGIMLALYVNHSERWLFFPLYFTIGAITIFHIFHDTVYLDLAQNIGGPIALVSIYYAGIKAKNNFALGLGIKYTLDFLTITLKSPEIIIIIELISGVFTVFLGLGLFKPIKETELQEPSESERKPRKEMESTAQNREMLNYIEVKE